MAASHRAVSNNLPAPLTSFVGRKREIAELCRLIRGRRLLTLTGAGGCGKSRLAIEVAARVLQDFRDGVWFVQLAALVDSNLVLQAVASVLGLREQPDQSLAAALADSLRSKSVLLVLDNCEHLAACADLADMLLRAAPGLRLISTSRAGLGVPGETLWRVPSLSVPEAEHVRSRDAVMLCEAARLFAERAASVRADFRVTEDNAPAVAQICRRLDGIPLALELAAARTGALTAEQIAARLDDRFGLLTGGSGAVLPRHRTLRAAMDWSYDLLTERGRTVLNRLSVFAGGWTLEAAEAVCAGANVEPPAVLDGLTSLVDNSLVSAEMSGSAARYRLPETVRQYARERLHESGETDAVRGRHGGFYLALVETAVPNLHGPDEAAWLDRFDVEHDNVRAALQWYGSGGGIEQALRLAGALGDFWDARGHYTEGRTWLRELLAMSGSVAPPVKIRAVNAAAGLAKHQGDLDAFKSLTRELLALAQSTNDTWGCAWAHHYLMHVADDQGDYPQAAAFMDDGLALAEQCGDAFGMISLLTCGGDLERGQRHYERAAVLLEEALRQCDLLNTQRSRIAPLHNLGYALLHLGKRQRAAALFREGLALARDVRIPRHLICGIGAVAGAHVEDAPEWAARLFGAMDAHRSAAGLHLMSVDQADVDRNIAAARERLGREAFEAAWTAGRRMTLNEAADAALSEAPAVIAAKIDTFPDGAQRNGLTRREREVASLIAEGLSNRQIAARLVIAERTAEGHVQSILNKMGFNSRAQIAAWAVQRGVDRAPAK